MASFGELAFPLSEHLSAADPPWQSLTQRGLRGPDGFAHHIAERGQKTSSQH
jgi:hypothetical protein